MIWEWYQPCQQPCTSTRTHTHTHTVYMRVYTHTHMRSRPLGCTGTGRPVAESPLHDQGGDTAVKVLPEPGFRADAVPSSSTSGAWRPARPDTLHPTWALGPLTLAAVLPVVASGTLLPTLAADRVAGHARGAGARLPAPWPKEAPLALCRGRGERHLQGSKGPGACPSPLGPVPLPWDLPALPWPVRLPWGPPPPPSPVLTVLAPLAPEARLAGTAAIPLIARTRILLLTLALLRAAWPKGPRRAGCTPECSVRGACPLPAPTPAKISGPVHLVVSGTPHRVAGAQRTRHTAHFADEKQAHREALPSQGIPGTLTASL